MRRAKQSWDDPFPDINTNRRIAGLTPISFSIYMSPLRGFHPVFLRPFYKHFASPRLKAVNRVDPIQARRAELRRSEMFVERDPPRDSRAPWERRRFRIATPFRAWLRTPKKGSGRFNALPVRGG